jgi:hypothetical protein
VLEHVVGHAVVDPIRLVAVAQHGIESKRVQVHDLASVSRIAQAFGKPLQNRVTERPRMMVRVHRQNSHG